MALIEKLSAIGNAIREKTGKEELLTLDAMPGEIAGIETGGGTNENELIEGLAADTWPTGNITLTGSSIKNAPFKAKPITSIVMPNVTDIPASGFQGCKQLQSVEAPEATTIGDSAFYDCSSLGELTFPKVTTMPGRSTFRRSSVTRLIFPALNALENYYHFGETKSLQVLDFHVLTKITAQLSFPSGSNCRVLVLRKSDGITTLNSGNAFNGVTFKAILVPSALIETYQTATNWSTYSVFQPLESYTEDGTIMGKLDESKIAGWLA